MPCQHLNDKKAISILKIFLFYFYQKQFFFFILSLINSHALLDQLSLSLSTNQLYGDHLDHQ